MEASSPSEDRWSRVKKLLLTGLGILFVVNLTVLWLRVYRVISVEFISAWVLTMLGCIIAAIIAAAIIVDEQL